MAIDTYAELKAAIEGWCYNGTAPAAFTAALDDFIGLAEADINSVLRVREMETATTLSLTNGDASKALPAGFIKARRAYISGTPQYELRLMPFAMMTVQFPDAETKGRPQAIAFSGGNAYFGPTSDASYSVPLIYFGRVTALSSGNTTSTILSAYSNVYLYGCLVHAYRWRKDYAMSDKVEGLFLKAVGQANGASLEGYTSGPLPAPALDFDLGCES